MLATVLVLIRRLLLGDTMKAVEKINQVEAEVRKKEESIRQEIEQHEKDFLQKKAEAEEALQKQKEQSEKELSLLRDRRESCSVRRAGVQHGVQRKHHRGTQSAFCGGTA